MQRVIVKAAKQGQLQRDLAYWLSRSVVERFAAVEALRREAQGLGPDDVEPRLQRVCRVSPRRGR